MRFTIRLACMAVLLAVPTSAWPAANQHDGSSRAAARCYATTEDWKAWVETGRGKPQLIVTGIVTTPTGLNSRKLVLGSATSGRLPQQFVDLEIKALAEVATMVVETEEVRGRFPALPAYGAVVIRCNGQEVGRVQPIVRRASAANKE